MEPVGSVVEPRVDVEEAAQMLTIYVCDWCADEGWSRLPIDQIQCPTCGEPVTLIAEQPDGPRSAD